MPIPAHAEIAVEGEIPPPDLESRDEGPFGEGTGYYSGGTIGTGEPQPVIRIKAVYYRDDPIIVNMSPQWMGAPHQGARHLFRRASLGMARPVSHGQPHR